MTADDEILNLKAPAVFCGRWSFGCQCGFAFESAPTDGIVVHFQRVLGHLRHCPVNHRRATVDAAVLMALSFLKPYYEDEPKDQRELLEKAIREYRKFLPRADRPRAPSCGVC